MHMTFYQTSQVKFHLNDFHDVSFQVVGESFKHHGQLMLIHAFIEMEWPNKTATFGVLPYEAQDKGRLCNNFVYSYMDNWKLHWQ